MENQQLKGTQEQKERERVSKALEKKQQEAERSSAMHEELTSMRIMMENAGVNPEKSLDEEAMMKVMQQFEQLNKT